MWGQPPSAVQSSEARQLGPSEPPNWDITGGSWSVFSHIGLWYGTITKKARTFTVRASALPAGHRR